MRRSENIPVIFLTASGDEASVVTGLSLGADDYVIKPFRPRELLARIENALRKAGRVQSTFAVGDVLVDTAGGTVRKDGKKFSFPRWNTACCLRSSTAPNAVLTRERLLDELWDAAGRVRGR